MSTEINEGVASFLYPSGELSVTEIETWDLLAEGEIGGFITGSYVYSGKAYNVGWDRATFTPYTTPPNTTGAQYLRSVYWNSIPVVNSNNQFNFQRTSIDWTPGYPDGEVLSTSQDNSLTFSKSIGERLFGSQVDANGNPTNEAHDYSKYYRIYNTKCRGAVVNIRISALASQITEGTDAGNITRTQLNYKIYYRPVFSTVDSIQSSSAAVSQITSDASAQFLLGADETVVGKITQGYIKSTQLIFNTDYVSQRNFAGWEIKIVRITPDSLSSSLRNQAYVDSITEIYTNIFSYPNSAMVYSKFSADFFQQVPERAFYIQGLKVKIPSNYNPITKTYQRLSANQEWDGSFTEENHWTDNPAWCFYDILTNKRYGVGDYFSEDIIDKFTLYQISKYCDTLVPDGYGGLEPRFTCNLVINSREDAYKVINDFASIFRSIVYYANGTIYTVQDSEKTPIKFFNNANVIDGAFQYNSSSIRNRHSIAIVRFNDKDNFYKPSIDYVEDFDAIRKYGVQELEMTAFGCTSKGQAIRLGRWALASEGLETETLSFQGGPEVQFLKPGDVVGVYDQFKKTERLCGRTSRVETWINDTNTITGHKLTLDNRISLNTGSIYTVYVNSPTYYYNSSQVTDIGSDDFSNIRRPQFQQMNFTGISATGTGFNANTTILLPTTFNTGDYSLINNGTWIVSLQSGSGINTFDLHNKNIDPSYDYYRIVRCAPKKAGVYEVNAITYNLDKYLKIESGLAFERPLTNYGIQPTSPSNLQLFLEEHPGRNDKIGYSFILDNYSGITSYRVFAKKDNFDSETIPSQSYLVANLPYNQTQASYVPEAVGDYFFRIYSVNDEVNIYSNGYTSGVITVANTNVIQNVLVNSLNFSDNIFPADLFATRETGYYTSSSPSFGWLYGFLENNVDSSWKYRISVRAPSNSNIPSSTIYYQNTGYLPQDRGTPTFAFDIDTNIAAGIRREYDIVVEAIDTDGHTSAGNFQDTSFAPYFTENWSNPNGYDIMYVNNNGISNVNLGNVSLYPNSVQFGPQGSPNITFENSTILPADIKGVYVYGSTGRFSGENITGNPIIPAIHTIRTGEVPLTSSSSQIYISNLIQNLLYDDNGTPRTTNNATGFLAVSFYDIFDKAVKDDGLNIQTGLSVSAVSGIKLYIGTNYSSNSPVT